MAEVIQLAKPEVKAEWQGGFVMTQSAHDMLRSLQLVSTSSGGAITLIAAAPGTGKTEALWHFKNSVRPKAVFHTAVANEDDTPWGAACHLMELLQIGVPNSRNLRSSRQQIAEAIGVDGLLIIDEGQNLIHRNPRGGTDWACLEWFRALSEDGCFSLAYCGDLALLEVSQRLPQLWRRMRRRVILKSVAKADVEALATWRGITDTKVIEALYQVARRGGGLGDVDNIIAHARLMSGGDQPQGDHVKAALEDLNLLHPGAQ